MFNPHESNHTQLTNHQKHLCPTCKGAGKQIHNMDGTMPKVSGHDKAQGTCPACMGKGFVQPVKWYRHTGGI